MAFTLGLQWGQCDVLVMLVFLLQFCPFPLDMIAFNLTFLTCKMGMLSRRGCCWEHRLLLYIWSTLRGPCIWLTLFFSHSWLRRFVLSCSVQMYGVWTWRKLRKVRDVQPPPFTNEETEVREVKPCSQCHDTEVLTFYLAIVLWFDLLLRL